MLMPWSASPYWTTERPLQTGHDERKTLFAAALSTAPSGAVSVCFWWLRAALAWPVTPALPDPPDPIFFRVQSPQNRYAMSGGILPVKLIFRLIALILFIVFFDFALKNTYEVVLHFFWGSQARSPMILLLLVFFVAGVALGVLAMMGTLLSHRRELARLRKEAEQQKKETTAAARVREMPPPPDSIIEQVGL